tara:strand:- start:141 stop:329 length:189 start_codon:yes stop_codon:yes gene_type:complete
VNDTATKDKERMPKSKGKVEPMMERIFEAILGGLGIMVLDFVETVGFKIMSTSRSWLQRNEE